MHQRCRRTAASAPIKPPCSQAAIFRPPWRPAPWARRSSCRRSSWPSRPGRRCGFLAGLPYCDSFSSSASSSARRAATFSISLSVAFSRKAASSSMLSASRSYLCHSSLPFPFGYREGAPATSAPTRLSTAKLRPGNFAAMHGNHNPATTPPHSRPNRRRQWRRDENQKGMGMSEQPYDAASEREEIAARVAHFKATQEKFEREREEYFFTTLDNARHSETRVAPSSARRSGREEKARSGAPGLLITSSGASSGADNTARRNRHTDRNRPARNSGDRNSHSPARNNKARRRRRRRPRVRQRRAERQPGPNPRASAGAGAATVVAASAPTVARTANVFLMRISSIE